MCPSRSVPAVWPDDPNQLAPLPWQKRDHKWAWIQGTGRSRKSQVSLSLLRVGQVANTISSAKYLCMELTISKFVIGNTKMAKFGCISLQDLVLWLRPLSKCKKQKSSSSNIVRHTGANLGSPDWFLNYFIPSLSPLSVQGTMGDIANIICWC